MAGSKNIKYGSTDTAHIYIGLQNDLMHEDCTKKDICIVYDCNRLMLYLHQCSSAGVLQSR